MYMSILFFIPATLIIHYAAILKSKKCNIHVCTSKYNYTHSTIIAPIDLLCSYHCTLKSEVMNSGLQVSYPLPGFAQLFF